MEETKGEEDLWKERADKLEYEAFSLKNQLLESEQKLLEAMVLERKKAKEIQANLVQMEEKYEMSKQAMESLTTKCISLESEMQILRERNNRNEEFIEKLAAQKAADNHIKEELDREIRRLKMKNRELTEEIGTLGLRLAVSQGDV